MERSSSTSRLALVPIRAALDRGAILENLAYIHLRRRTPRIEYVLTRSGQEVDFIVDSSTRGGRELVQVSWTLESPDTRERELGALSEAMRELRIRSGTVVTWLEEGKEERIRIVPAWKWLLE